jgi:predicted lipoprotein with Yx(FWY)xxD motif
MTRRRNIFLGAALAAPVAALAIAGCGGNGDAVKASSPAATKAAGAGGGATVDVRTTKLGKTLVDSQGRTLYLFEKDKGMKSTCFGACASVWPPFTTSGKPQAGAGVSASLLGTTARSDGKPEVTYNGHPLYYYASDQKPGDTTGEGLDQFGAKWYVLSPSGKKIDND